MKRGWIGAGILVFFLVLGLWVGSVMGRAHSQTEAMLNEAAEKAISGQFEEGTALAMKAKDRWQQHWHSTATVADHGPMDDVDALFGKMQVYAKVGDATHFAACCAELAQRIGAVAEVHSCNWWNVL